VLEISLDPGRVPENAGDLASMPKGTGTAQGHARSWEGPVSRSGDVCTTDRERTRWGPLTMGPRPEAAPSDGPTLSTKILSAPESVWNGSAKSRAASNICWTSARSSRGGHNIPYLDRG